MSNKYYLLQEKPEGQEEFTDLMDFLEYDSAFMSMNNMDCIERIKGNKITFRLLECRLLDQIKTW